MSYQIPDPNSLTIPKLKSVLTQHGFGDQLPAHQEKKGFYVDLYRKHIVPLLEARNAASSQSLTPGPTSTTSATSAKERPTKTDLVDRRRTIQSLAPEPTAAAPTSLTQTKPVAKPAASTGPTTPAAKADAAPAASMPRRLFAPEQQPTTDHVVSKTPSASTTRPSSSSSSSSSSSTSSSSSSSSTSSAPILSPKASASRRTTIATGTVSYPKLAPAPAAATTKATSSAGPDLRQIIALQHARKKSGGGGSAAMWLFGLLVLAVAVGAGLFMYGQLPSLLQAEKPYFCDTTGVSDHRQSPREPVVPCVDCPNFGVCKDGRLIKCMRGYEVSGGVHCARDKEIALAFEFCKEAAHKTLALRAGEHQCGYPVPALPMAEQELRDILKQQMKDAALFPWDEAKFNEAFLDLKKDLQRSTSRSNVLIRASNGNYTFDTTDVVVPFRCVLQRVVLEHIWYIVGTLVALAAGLRFVRLQQAKAQREADIETLVESTKTLIKEEKKAGKPPSSVLHIREDQREKQTELKKRYPTVKDWLSIWAVAENRVRADTRFKEYSQMVAGTQQQVWEYVGTVDDAMAEKILSPRSRKSYPH